MTATAQQLPQQIVDPAARIVVVGAGVVGAALADELTSRGAANVTLIDQGPLFETGGSSSHAPGFVFQTNGSRAMARLAKQTMDKLDGLELDGKPLVNRVGGLELALTPGQYQEIERRHGFAVANGIPSELIGPECVAQLWPDLDVTRVLGALHTPTDGIVFSARAAEYQARRAQAAGAELLELTRVIDVERDPDTGHVTGVVVEDARTTGEAAAGNAATAPGVQGGPNTGDAGSRRTGEPATASSSASMRTRRTIAADVVVAAGGIWGPLLGQWAGLALPMRPMEHGFAWTPPVPGLPESYDDGSPLDSEDASRPIVRYQGAGLYFRQFGTRIGIGAYEHGPIPVAPEDLTDTAQMLATGAQPAKRSFTTKDFAFDHAQVARVLPAISGLGLEDEFNGVFSFTPDGGPMLGPVRTLPGLWVAQAIWVTQSAGCAQVMADWMLGGNPGIDTHELDFNRFDPALLGGDWIAGRAAESYDEVYDVHFPHQTTNVVRNLKTSPFHTRIQDLGGVFIEANGWERPLWLESNRALFHDPEFTGRAQREFGDLAEAAAVGAEIDQDDLDAPVPVAVPRRDAWDQVNWSPVAAAEAWAARNRVVMHDMTSLTRFRVRGAGATAWLEGLNSNKIGKSVGAVTYSLLLDELGGILSDITVTRIGEEDYMLGVNGALDLDRLNRLLPETGTVVVDDITTSTCCIGLWGPRARDVLEPLTQDDISHAGLKYFRSARIRVAGVPVLALRVSYIGELGWELYTPAAHGLRLWDAVMAAGAPHKIIAAGRQSFSSLRLEKGYRAWGADMNREDRPADAGVGFAVRMAKDGGFVGRNALEEAPSHGRKLVAFGSRMDDGRPEAGAAVLAPSGGAVAMAGEAVGTRAAGEAAAGTGFGAGGAANWGDVVGRGDAVGWVTSADYGYVTGQVIGLAWVPDAYAEPGSKLGIMRFGQILDATVLAEPVYDPTAARIRR